MRKKLVCNVIKGGDHIIFGTYVQLEDSTSIWHQKFCVWDFPIKSYDFLKKSCQKAKLKKALQKNISVPIGIDFSVLK